MDEEQLSRLEGKIDRLLALIDRFMPLLERFSNAKIPTFGRKR